MIQSGQVSIGDVLCVEAGRAKAEESPVPFVNSGARPCGRGILLPRPGISRLRRLAGRSSDETGWQKAEENWWRSFAERYLLTPGAGALVLSGETALRLQAE
jgi:hypothetical protein